MLRKEASHALVIGERFDQSVAGGKPQQKSGSMCSPGCTMAHINSADFHSRSSAEIGSC